MPTPSHLLPRSFTTSDSNSNTSTARTHTVRGPSCGGRFAEKVADIVGLYLDPSDGAGVLCVDEKSGVQALDRTQPLLPMTFHKTEKRTHDDVRHGAINLFGTLDVATGKVVGACYPRRGSEEYLAFMKTVAAQFPGRELHVVLDNRSLPSTHGRFGSPATAATFPTTRR